MTNVQNDDFVKQLSLAEETVEKWLRITKPHVIDPGSQFLDDDLHIHREACGWLAIQAGIHFTYYILRMSEHYKRKYLSNEFLPKKLKQMSGIYSYSQRICDIDIQTLANNIGITIIRHEANTIVDDYGRPCLDHIEPTKTREFKPTGIQSAFTVNILLAGGHYRLIVDNVKYAKDFAKEFASNGYQYMQLGTTLTDAELARQIDKELNGDDIGLDRYNMGANANKPNMSIKSPVTQPLSRTATEANDYLPFEYLSDEEIDPFTQLTPKERQEQEAALAEFNRLHIDNTLPSEYCTQEEKDRQAGLLAEYGIH